MSINQRLHDLGILLPSVKAPAANYANATRTGNLVYVSGTVPVLPNGDLPKGKVGRDVTTAEAASHARLVGLQILAILKQEIGDLDRAVKVVKLLGTRERGTGLRRAFESHQWLLRFVRRDFRRTPRAVLCRRRQLALRTNPRNRGNLRGDVISQRDAGRTLAARMRRFRQARGTRFGSVNPK